MHYLITSSFSPFLLCNIREYLSVYFTHCIVVVVRVPIVLLLYLAATLATNSINTLPLHYNRGSSGKMIVKNGLCVCKRAHVCVWVGLSTCMMDYLLYIPE